MSIHLFLIVLYICNVTSHHVTSEMGLTIIGSEKFFEEIVHARLLQCTETRFSH